MESVKDARAEDGKLLRHAQARQAELESSNASLNEHLAKKSQELDLAYLDIKRLEDECSSLEASSATLPHNLGPTNHHSNNNAAIALKEAEEKLERLKAKEMEETLKMKRTEEEMNHLRHELTAVRLSCDSEAKAARAAELRAQLVRMHVTSAIVCVVVAHARNCYVDKSQAEEALKEKSMAAAAAAAAATTVTLPPQPLPAEDMKDMLINELREKLMEKQSLLDDVLSNKSAFQARLHSATTRMHKMEARLMELGDGFEITDIEEGGGGNQTLSESNSMNNFGDQSSRTLLTYRGEVKQPVGMNSRKQIFKRSSILVRSRRVRRVLNTLDR